MEMSHSTLNLTHKLPTPVTLGLIFWETTLVPVRLIEVGRERNLSVSVNEII